MYVNKTSFVDVELVKPQSASKDVPEIDQFAETFSQLEFRTPPGLLYHYTSNETLLSIIKARSLWLTHALFMNDASEFSHGMTKFLVALDVLEAKGVEKPWLDKIREFFRRETSNPLASPYVFSLTEEPDQLSQWRGYGDFGGGVSMGIDTQGFSQLSDIHFKVIPVIYDHGVQDQIVKNVMDGFVALIMQLGPKLDDAKIYGPALALGYFQVAYMQSIRFKDHTWKEECEWRAIALAGDENPKVFLRDRGKSLVKTFDLKIPNLHVWCFFWSGTFFTDLV